MRERRTGSEKERICCSTMPVPPTVKRMTDGTIASLLRPFTVLVKWICGLSEVIVTLGKLLELCLSLRAPALWPSRCKHEYLMRRDLVCSTDLCYAASLDRLRPRIYLPVKLFSTEARHQGCVHKESLRSVALLSCD